MLIKFIRFFLISLDILVFLLLVVVQIWLQVVGYGFSVSNWIYWLIFFNLVFFALKYKWQSLVFFTVAFPLLIIGVIFTIIQLNQIAETIFRVSFIFWLVGIGSALVEYKKPSLI